MTFSFSCKAKAWKGLASLLKTMQEEATFAVDQQGVHINCINGSRVTQIDFTWLHTNLKEFKYDDIIATLVGFSTKSLDDVMRRFDKDAEIALAYTGEGLLQISNEAKHYSLRLIPGDAVEAPRKIKVDLEINIPTSFEKLQEILGDLQFMQEAMTFEVKEGKFSIYSEGDTAKAHLLISNSMVSEIEAYSEYNIPYLQDLVTAMKDVAESVMMHWGTDKPLHLVMQIPEAGELNYYLSPYGVK